MRLDKVLAHLGFGSRKEVKKLLKDKKVQIDHKIVTKADVKINVEQQLLIVDGQEIRYEKKLYIMLHKPDGVVSATEDNLHETVIDLMPQVYQNRKLFPVGRLDKDTEGLLILTNDGDVGHVLTSPKHRIKKTYYAQVEGRLEAKHIEEFKKGIVLNDGYQCHAADLKIITSGEQSEIYLTITEGKFHQVKRMFQAIGMTVVYLKRVQMGEIILDETLPLGQYRKLNEAEIAYIESLTNKSR